MANSRVIDQPWKMTGDTENDNSLKDTDETEHYYQVRQPRRYGRNRLYNSLISDGYAAFRPVPYNPDDTGGRK